MPDVGCDFLVVGGGIAGMSAAASLARHGKVTVLEAESASGYHSSGRSAAVFHFGIGTTVIRALTAFSRTHFESVTDDGVALSSLLDALFVATQDMVGDLHDLERRMAPFCDRLETLDEAGVREVMPILKCGADDIVGGLIDRNARRLDSDALLQDYRAALRRHGGDLVTSGRVSSIEYRQGLWCAAMRSGQQFAAPILINAAGAWADEIAELSGVQPMQLQPLRRTMIAFDPPNDTPIRDLPFTKTVRDDFYILPQSGQLLASPVDEILSPAMDARPEDFDVASAAAKVERYTNVKLHRIRHSWAGLRTFTRDRSPIAGFAKDAHGFFWLVGQGGSGLQTAPAMAAIAEALICHTPWPAELGKLGVLPAHMAPERETLQDADEREYGSNRS